MRSINKSSLKMSPHLLGVIRKQGSNQTPIGVEYALEYAFALQRMALTGTTPGDENCNFSSEYSLAICCNFNLFLRGRPESVQFMERIEQSDRMSIYIDLVGTNVEVTATLYVTGQIRLAQYKASYSFVSGNYVRVPPQ